MTLSRRFDLSYFLFGVFATLLAYAFYSSAFLIGAFFLVGPCHGSDVGVFWARVILGVWLTTTPFFLFFLLRWFWKESRSRL